MGSDIDALRAAAKRLKKDYAAGDAAARRRLEAVIGETAAPKYADFLHVIARELGHQSWPKLKFALESAAMSRAQRAERLKTALFYGQAWVARKLLGDDPLLADHDFGLQIATYDLGAVRRALSDPAKATERIGRRSPILHLSFSRYIHMSPDKRDDMLSIAELLVTNGADPNDGFPPEPGSDHRLSALYGALGHADNPALAEWLLDHGASPDDDESLYHATELGHREGLKLLLRHGARIRGTNALPRALDFDDVEAVRILLDHGADPNEAVCGHPSGQPVDTVPALHQAARRWCSGEIARLLLNHGADPTSVWRGHTPFGLAMIFGNGAVAEVLRERGHATPLSDVERVLADCASGLPPRARIDPNDLSEEASLLATRVVARPERLDHLKALILAGLDPDRTEEMGLTPLHVAGWEGLAPQVAYLLTLAPDLGHRNGFGGDALATVIHGAEHCPARRTRDHVDCARLLLEAGAGLRQEQVDACGSEKLAVFLEGWIEQGR